MTGHIYCFARRLTILVPCAVLFACANPEPGGSAASSTASSTSSSTALSGKDPIFATFVDSYFDSLYTFAPSQGTAAGFHQYDDKVEDLSAANIGRRIATLHALQSRLDSIRTRQLVLDDSIDAAMIDGAIKSELQDAELLANWKKNPMNYVGLPGNAVDLLMKRNFAPPVDRLKSVTARLRGVPAVLAVMRQNVVNPPREFTDLAMRIAAGSVGFFKDDVAKWAKGAAGTDTATLGEFTRVNDSVATAMQGAAAKQIGA